MTSGVRWERWRTPDTKLRRKAQEQEAIPPREQRYVEEILLHAGWGFPCYEFIIGERLQLWVSGEV